MIPRTVYSEEHELFRASVRKFLETEVLPHHDAWEKAGQVDRDLWRKAGAQGYLAPQAR
jgi:alkylation response protein AidB-like acyl-CoA dehydrogenase